MLGLIYILKTLEFGVAFILGLVLLGAYYKLKDGHGTEHFDRLEYSILGLLSLSTLIHIINLFL